MPVTTTSKVGFQLNDFGYVGACIFQDQGGGVRSCSGDYQTYQYNPTTEQWLANGDTIRDNPALFSKEQQTAFVFNDKAYLYDGSFRVIYKFDEVNNAWQEITTTEARARAPFAEVVNDKVYVGLSPDGELFELNPETGTIENTYQFPGDRFPSFSDLYFGSFTLGSRIYVAYAEHYYFDIDTKTWESFAAAPGIETEFFTYQGSAYQVSGGRDPFSGVVNSTRLWQYFPQ